jgi:hypothetical protein
MAENRNFLNNLCQTLRFYKNGKAVAPEQIMFNIEIPESSIVRDAQDMGISVEEHKAKSLVAKAFASLADMVVLTLSSSRRKKRRGGVGIVRILILLALALGYLGYSLKQNPVITSHPLPQALTPEQARTSETKVIRHTFQRGDNIYRIAKHAISKFVGIVPTDRQLSIYVNETINIHNATNLSTNQIKNANEIQEGQVLAFYLSNALRDLVNEEMLQVYDFFMKLTDDPLSYITGDWQERGFGSDSRHDGIDVAGLLGSNVKTPISGIVINKESPAGGRITGIVSREDGYLVYFAHLDKRFFNSGDSISAGTVVGTIGMTGRTSGPHVHVGFGIRTLDPSGVAFGRSRYKNTDPKFLYYRLAYKENGRR